LAHDARARAVDGSIIRGRSIVRGCSIVEPRLGVALLGVAFAAALSEACTPPAASGQGVASGSTVARAAAIQFDFPAAGEDVVVNSETMRGRVTALVFITTFDLASQLLVRRLGEVIVAFTPRANAAAVVVEAPRYAELLPAYRQAMSLPYPVVMADFATQQGGGPFGNIANVPTLIVLDRDGREVFRHQGALDGSAIQAALRSAR
jgi:hypothetical protein